MIAHAMTRSRCRQERRVLEVPDKIAGSSAWLVALVGGNVGQLAERRQPVIESPLGDLGAAGHSGPGEAVREQPQGPEPGPPAVFTNGHDGRSPKLRAPVAVDGAAASRNGRTTTPSSGGSPGSPPP